MFHLGLEISGQLRDSHPRKRQPAEHLHRGKRVALGLGDEVGGRAILRCGSICPLPDRHRLSRTFSLYRAAKSSTDIDAVCM